LHRLGPLDAAGHRDDDYAKRQRRTPEAQELNEKCLESGLRHIILQSAFFTTLTYLGTIERHLGEIDHFR
jgi:hypothetical protein